MDLTSIATWLKSTVPGIILLGAIGSLIAAGVVGLLSRVFSRWLPTGVAAYIEGKRRIQVRTADLLQHNDPELAFMLLAYIMLCIIASTCLVAGCVFATGAFIAASIHAVGWESLAAVSGVLIGFALVLVLFLAYILEGMDKGVNDYRSSNPLQDSQTP